MERTNHLPLTLIKHLKPPSSTGPFLKADPNGSRISNLAESGEMAISVSGTGVGEGDGEYERSPGVYPWVGREIPVGGENLNGPLGVSRVSVAGLKFRDPENAI
jgi:hypothetical protein